MFPTTLQHGSGRAMTLDPLRLLVCFEKPPTPRQLKDVLLGLKCTLEEDAPGSPPARLNRSTRAFWLRVRGEVPIAPAHLTRVRPALGGAGFVGPVYRLPGLGGLHGILCPHPNVLLLRLSPAGAERSPRDLGRMLAAHGLVEQGARSRRLAPARYCVVSSRKPRLAYDLRDELLQTEAPWVRDAAFEVIPLLHPAGAQPATDTYYADQWNLQPMDLATNPGGIDAEAAWDAPPTAAGTGDPGVFLCVVDSGVELNHIDLKRGTTHLGWDPASGLVGTNLGGPVEYPAGSGTLDAHGTAMAGIAAASWDNGAGIAGIAGGCSIFSVPVPKDPTGLITESNVVAALNEAVTEGALTGEASPPRRVIVVGYSSASFSAASFQPTLDAAVANDYVVCVAAGNDVGGDGSAGVFAPADHKDVIACGAVTRQNDRVVSQPSSHYPPDWSSPKNSTKLSVVAPGVGLATTDLTGTKGYNTTGAAPDYANAAYHKAFEGTCAAAAHVAGVAALLRSAYPSLKQGDVKRIIERTAVRVKGSAATYTYDDDLTLYPSGPYNHEKELGYGRLSAGRAARLADVYIKDFPGDQGVEPTTDPYFWRDSDFVCSKAALDRATLEQGPPYLSWDSVQAAVPARQVDTTVDPNYAYVRVFNNGPGAAANVRVRAVIMNPAIGIGYPRDWKAASDPSHQVLAPAPFPGDSAAGDLYVIPSIPAGGQRVVQFTITQLQALHAKNNWGTHFCGVAAAFCDQDSPFMDWDSALLATDAVGGQQVRRNNLIQRNLDIVPANSPWFFPFLAGNLGDPGTHLEIVVEGAGLPAGAVARLALDEPERAFPTIDFERLRDEERARGGRGAAAAPSLARFVVLDHARVRASLLGAEGILTLAGGSSLELLASSRPKVVEARGGRVVLSGDRRSAEFGRTQLTLRLEKRPHDVLPLYLEVPVPAGVRRGQRFTVDVYQRDAAGHVMGGLTLILVA